MKKGDKVKVVSLTNSFYDLGKANEKIKACIGKAMTVKRVYPNGSVTLENCSFVFSVKDLEKIEKEGE